MGKPSPGLICPLYIQDCSDRWLETSRFLFDRIRCARSDLMQSRSQMNMSHSDLYLPEQLLIGAAKMIRDRRCDDRAVDPQLRVVMY
jgi:hypothetical protein